MLRSKHVTARLALWSLMFCVALCGSGCIITPKATHPSSASQIVKRLNLGFDENISDMSWRVGDMVVYELTTFDGQREQLTFLRYTILDEASLANWTRGVARTLAAGSGEGGQQNYVLTPILVEWFDAEGELLHKGHSSLLKEKLLLGLFGPLKALDEIYRRKERWDQSPTGRAAMHEVVVTLIGFQMAFSQKGVRPILDHMLDRVIVPSWWQLLKARKFNFRVGAFAETQVTQQCSVVINEKARSAMQMKVNYRFSREVVAHADLKIIDPAPPYFICGGIVELDLRPLNDSSRWLKARLVSARRSSHDNR